MLRLGPKRTRAEQLAFRYLPYQHTCREWWREWGNNPFYFLDEDLLRCNEEAALLWIATPYPRTHGGVPLYCNSCVDPKRSV